MSPDRVERWLICRICLKSENKKLYNIFETIVEDEIEDLGTNLLEKIELCGAIKLCNQDNLPKKICNRCVLLLRAACKFRDLCLQSQNQLKQFIATVSQRVEDPIEISCEKATDDEPITESREDIDNEEPTDGDYLIEESVDEFDNISNSKTQSTAAKCNEYLDIPDEVEVHELSDFENSQYIVEEVNSKEYVNEEDSESIIKYENDFSDDNIIFEEVPRKPEREYFTKRFVEDKPTAKRKRKQSQNEAVNVVYNCTLCDNTYVDKTKYNNHMKIHANDKPHECEICKKRFSTTPQLSRHMNSHTGNRPYKCQYCVSSFGDPSTKIKHERIHTNERPFKCSVCNKAFAYSNVLKVHMMTHTGEKPHSCEYCGKRFSQVHHKNAHEKRHTNVNMVIVHNSSDVEYMEEEELKGYKIEEII